MKNLLISLLALAPTQGFAKESLPYVLVTEYPSELSKTVSVEGDMKKDLYKNGGLSCTLYSSQDTNSLGFSKQSITVSCFFHLTENSTIGNMQLKANCYSGGNQNRDSTENTTVLSNYLLDKKEVHVSIFCPSTTTITKK